MNAESVLLDADLAKKAGATRFCMGAAWKEVKDGPQFDQVLDIVTKVNEMGMEVTITLMGELDRNGNGMYICRNGMGMKWELNQE